MSFILLGILNSQVESAAGGAYELIESNILATSASSVTFSSIPQDYKHLQIRAVGRSASTDSQQQWRITLNNDTGANYAYHRLFGNGSSVTSQGFSSTSSCRVGYLPTSTATANAFGSLLIDFLDYSSTAKNSTIRSLSGADTFTTVSLQSALWNNTAAVTTIKLEDSGANNLVAGSRFSLYGIRG